MSMVMLARLLEELRKDVRALASSSRDEPLPSAVAPEKAAKLLGRSLRRLKRDIRLGQIRTVPVGDHQYVPMSEIVRVRASAERGPQEKTPTSKRRRGSGSKRKR